jgi:hypothetical protein
MPGPNQSARHRARIFLLIVAAALIVAGMYWGGARPPGAQSQPQAPRPPSPPPATGSPAPSASASSAPIISPNGEEASHVADLLNSPATDIHSDLRIVNELFDQYRSAVHGPNPVGENAAIVAVLTGKNALDYYFLPPRHPAINAAGQLVDRWGTPFFFHQLSSDQMQIRSAGPDRKMYTGDDEVLTPGLYQPHL